MLHNDSAGTKRHESQRARGALPAQRRSNLIPAAVGSEENLLPCVSTHFGSRGSWYLAVAISADIPQQPDIVAFAIAALRSEQLSRAAKASSSTTSEFLTLSQPRPATSRTSRAWRSVRRRSETYANERWS
jgi:hypothetical protein